MFGPTPWTPDSSYWIPAGYGLLIPDFLLVELGFRIAIVTDSKTKPKSKSKTLLDSRIRIPSHAAKFRRQLAFQIPAFCLIHFHINYFISYSARTKLKNILIEAYCP